MGQSSCVGRFWVEEDNGMICTAYLLCCHLIYDPIFLFFI